MCTEFKYGWKILNHELDLMLTTVPHLKQEYKGKYMQGTHSSRKGR